MVLEDPHKVLCFRQNVARDALAPGSQHPKRVVQQLWVCLKIGETNKWPSTNGENGDEPRPGNMTKISDPGPALFEHQLLTVVRNNPNALVETSFEASHLLRNVRPFWCHEATNSTVVNFKKILAIFRG